MRKEKIEVQGIAISINDEGYLSLTDIAKKSSDREPSSLIQSWLRNQSTLSFLETWESLNNDNFKPSQMAGFRILATERRNVVSIKRYISETQAIGIISKSGRYGGTYSHSDIALNFCYWLSPPFQVYLLKEFQRLKADEQLRLGDPMNIKRHLTSGNYSLLVSSIIGQTDERLLTHPQPYKGRLPIASESDMLNKIVFGNTAKEWRLQNTDKPTNRNQRDYASILDLVILNNLEFLDSMLLQWDLDKEERKGILEDAYTFQYPILKRSKTIKRLQPPSSSFVSSENRSVQLSLKTMPSNCVPLLILKVFTLLPKKSFPVNSVKIQSFSFDAIANLLPSGLIVALRIAPRLLSLSVAKVDCNCAMCVPSVVGNLYSFVCPIKGELRSRVNNQRLLSKATSPSTSKCISTSAGGKFVWSEKE